MDIVFVNSMYFQELHTTDLGSIILQNRLDKDIESIIINFDRLIREDIQSAQPPAGLCMQPCRFIRL